MKLMIASDLHGSAYYTKKLLEAMEVYKPEKLILLGDLLYHGPRNDLPKNYAPKEVLAMLNGVKDKLLCVRGNCDGEVDQMVLDFPIMADYAVLFADGMTIYATHGHRYGEDNPPPLERGSILLCGHTHIPAIHEHETFTYVNPGSVSLPKEGTDHSFLIFENGRFTFGKLL